MSDRRYHAKREAGISPVRKDGSLTSPVTDEQAAAAEQWACEIFGQPYNSDIYPDHGDEGHDLVVEGFKAEVVWLGYHKGTNQPRTGDGHLIVNPYEPHRHADLYLVVSGSTETGFALEGWAFHTDIEEAPTKDFGYGQKKAIHVKNLRSFAGSRYISATRTWPS